MAKYSVGDKVVPNEDIIEAPEWFRGNYVTIDEIHDEGGDNEQYYVVPSSEEGIRDFSWLEDGEIDHVATEKLNKA